MRIHGMGRAWKAGVPLAAMVFAGRHGGGFGPGHGYGRGGGRGDGEDWSGRRGGRGRSRVFGPGELRLVLLHLVSEQPRHGYDLIKSIEELTGGNYAPSPGVVYPTLSLMTDEGVTDEQAATGSRKAFAATLAGTKELAEKVDEVATLIERLKALAEAEPHSAPPIGRAIANLMSALRSRAMTGDFDKENVHQVAEILDEAARKIERL
ncbi:MAG: PadR family transcriptional regulator [Novosphingobium sp.]